MPKESLLDEFEEEYDPLLVDDDVIDQEEMDDDNPYDTIDYPTLRNMPEDSSVGGVYTPENMGSVRNALLELFDHNPGRRLVLLGILDMCRDGMHASEVADRVDEMQKDNLSVYGPSMLCRMLQRAGALDLEMPEVSEEHEDVEAGVEYLEIKETIDPVWRTNAEGLAVYDEVSGDAAFRSIVLDRDSKYLEVYLAVMEALADHPRSKDEIEKLVDTFEVVQNPRRFGGHFIDMLEKTDAIEWKDRAWTISDTGRELIPVVREQFSAKGE